MQPRRGFVCGIEAIALQMTIVMQRWRAIRAAAPQPIHPPSGEGREEGGNCPSIGLAKALYTVGFPSRGF